MYDMTPAMKGVTKASRMVWLPLVLGGGGVAAGLATGLMWLFAPLGAIAAGGAGAWLWRKHGRELEVQHAQAIETEALAIFRRHAGSTMTKEQLVRDHRLHPDEADEVLNWLVTHELLVANWEDYEGPMVYERSDAAAGLPLPAPGAAGPPPAAPGKQVVVHQYQEQPRPMAGVTFKNPGLAMALSSVWPGLGQMYCGRVGRGVAWILGSGVAWAMSVALFFPGPLVHLLNVFDARSTADRVNRHIQRFGVPPGVPRPMPKLAPPPQRRGPPPRPPRPPRR